MLPSTGAVVHHREDLFCAKSTQLHPAPPAWAKVSFHMAAPMGSLGALGWLVQPLPPPAAQIWATVFPLMVGLVLLICKSLACLVLRSLGT